MNDDKQRPPPGFAGFSLAERDWSLDDLGDGVERVAGNADAATSAAALADVTLDLEGYWNDEWETQGRILDSIHRAMKERP